MKKLTAIQASAKGEECTFNLGCCNHDRETTVLCHDTRYVLGSSERRCDARASYGCSACHAEMDGEKIAHEIKGYIWDKAKARTHVKLIEKGLLIFEGVESKPSKILPRKH